MRLVLADVCVLIYHVLRLRIIVHIITQYSKQ